MLVVIKRYIPIFLMEIRLRTVSLKRIKFHRHNRLCEKNFSFFDDKLKVDISVNYINQKTINRPSGGTFFNPIYQLYTAPRNLDMDYYRKIIMI